MGTLSEFTCPNCYYSAEVCGGIGFGFHVVLVTISCEDCKELLDAKAKEKPEEIWDSEPRIEPSGYCCPKDPNHRFTAWSHPGPCPKCGTEMGCGDSGIDWN